MVEGSGSLPAEALGTGDAARQRRGTAVSSSWSTGLALGLLVRFKNLQAWIMAGNTSSSTSNAMSKVDRNTVKAHVLKLFKSEKVKLQTLLSSVQGRLCLTADLWTSLAIDGYLTITAHFVDSEWRLRKKITNFCHMLPPHNGVALADKILSCSVLCSHQVQDGLKAIDPSVIKVHDCIKYIKGSSARKERFLECVAQVGLRGSRRGLRQDVPTRWNSTYLMLDSALYYRRALMNLGLSDNDCKLCPVADEWAKIEKITKFLGYFYEVTWLFSGTKYPTSNLFFPKVFIVQHSIQEAMMDHDSFMRRMGMEMNLKFEKYWSDYSLILGIAVVMDPRFKMQFVEWAYDKLYGPDSSQLEVFNDTLSSLFDAYVEKSFDHNDSNNSIDEGSSQAQGDHSLLEAFDNAYKIGSSSSMKTELSKYLDEVRLERKQELDVLSWWKMEQIRYPILFHLARDVLTIPISTIASESAFSIGGRVLDQYRSSLLPDTVQALLCTRDWIFGNKEKERAELEDLTEDVFDLTLQDRSGEGESRN
ncbi:zinc finger BED domain-containing protein RICESLEEPER 2-like [Rosa chinensis]|uniref:zinc finger BED domain-containing protein RICESLEEPER 2-like n=1 Tax=Rosa chinensis TaxID=74649 RepID=UPI001AD90517|nr:zinc finger BED domain-containing protein RICESLEEPER 2-like [Rosa chinensis]